MAPSPSAEGRRDAEAAVSLTERQLEAVSWAEAAMRDFAGTPDAGYERGDFELDRKDRTLTLRSRAAAEDLTYRLDTQLQDMGTDAADEGGARGLQLAARNAAEKVREQASGLR